MWFLFALLSAVFAALTSILAKIGINGVNSNLAHSNPNSSSGIYGMGNGVPNECAERNFRNQQEKLDVSDFIRFGNRGILAVLL